MQRDNLKSYLNLHLIVQADALVWYRMLIAAVFLFFFILFKKESFQIPGKEFLKLIFVGLLIALHWIFFFEAIHVSNVSITLAVFSLGAFLASILEPIFYGRKVLWYEVFFGLVIIAALSMILQVEINYFNGILYALVSIIIGVLFTLMNGKLIEKHEPSVITFYEFLAGVFFITIYFCLSTYFILGMYCLCFYCFSKSNANIISLYSNANHEFRTGLWYHFGLFYHWRKRKNERRILYWSRFDCGYGNSQRDCQALSFQ